MTHEHSVAYAYVIALVCKATGGIAYVDEPLVLWRRHEKAATFAGRSDIGAFAGVLKSLLSVFNSRKRDVLKRYFAAVSVLPFDNKDTRQLVCLMLVQSLRVVLAAYGRFATWHGPAKPD